MQNTTPDLFSFQLDTPAPVALVQPLPPKSAKLPRIRPDLTRQPSQLTADAYTAAAREHEERTRQLATLAADLDALAKHYEGQGNPQAAEPAEPAQLLRVFYVCPRCSHKWEEEYSSACDSECPECNFENIEADRWEDIDAESPETAARCECGRLAGDCATFDDANAEHADR